MARYTMTRTSYVASQSPLEALGWQEPDYTAEDVATMVVDLEDDNVCENVDSKNS